MKATKKLTLAVVVFALLVATASSINNDINNDKTTSGAATTVEKKSDGGGDIVLSFRLKDYEALKLRIRSADEYTKPPTRRIEKIPAAGLIIHPSAENPLVLGSGTPGNILIKKSSTLLSNFTIRTPFEVTITQCDVAVPGAEDGIYLYNCPAGEAVLQIKKRPLPTKELKLIKPDVIINGSRAVFPGFEVVKIASMKTINLPNPRLVKITVSASETTMWRCYAGDNDDTYDIYDGYRAILAAHEGDSAYAFFPESNTTITIEVWGETDYKPHKVEEFTTTRAFYLAFPHNVPVFAQKDGYTATFYLQPRDAAIYQIVVVEEG